MTKRQWLLVAGTLVLAGCHGITDTCVTAGSAVQNHNRDEVGFVECSDTQVTQPAEKPAPKVGQPAGNQP